MKRRHWAHLFAVAAAAVAVAAAAPAAASEPAGGAETGGPPSRSARAADGPSAAAAAYLRARATAIVAADPVAVLAPWVVPGSPLARSEARMALGAALRYGDTGRTAVSAACGVTVLDVQPSDDGVTVSVGARSVTTVTWRNAAGKSGSEASGIDHTITLTKRDGGWAVAADAYTDVLRPACLEAAGASSARVRRAARDVERRSAPLTLPVAARAKAPPGVRAYSDIIQYDRPSAQTYADTYALSYNPTFVRFDGADCANFVSQCARAGDMLQSSGAFTSGWWYDKDGSSGPADDTYSLSWINVTRQMGFWNGRRTDWETSAGMLSRGDAIYYDWSGDGVWDHVAIVAGTNSAGQKMIDAHTTDHYHVYWKLGYSGTRYRFARVRPSWVV
jgi:hypothetical protein